jgi:hypothetical protein
MAEKIKEESKEGSNIDLKSVLKKDLVVSKSTKGIASKNRSSNKKLYAINRMIFLF